MPTYHRLGEFPQKRHTQFRKPDGGLYREEVMGLEGFDGIQSVLYHHNLPPRVSEAELLGPYSAGVCRVRPTEAPRIWYG